MGIEIPVRVVIADDHDMVRSSIALCLKTFDDLELVGEATNGREALRLCAELEPDVVLMDMEMPEMDGVAATRAIVQLRPEVKVIALASLGDQLMVQEALQAGAARSIPKSASIDALAEAIRASCEREDADPNSRLCRVQ
ncbi:MAG: response regulator transcription factor [Chloroflexi bacterium]|nr:response regulator transcription factor [Chloroflexota bacterium]